MASDPQALDLLPIVRRTMIKMLRRAPPGTTVQTLAAEFEMGEPLAMDTLQAVLSEVVQAPLERVAVTKS